jgi:hypothetical protein
MLDIAEALNEVHGLFAFYVSWVNVMKQNIVVLKAIWLSYFLIVYLRLIFQCETLNCTLEKKP